MRKTVYINKNTTEMSSQTAEETFPASEFSANACFLWHIFSVHLMDFYNGTVLKRLPVYLLVN